MSVQHVVLYAHPTMADWEYSFLTPHLYQHSRTHPDLLNYRVCGETDESVRTLGGLVVTPEGALANQQTTKHTTVVLPGGDWRTGHDVALEFVGRVLAAGGAVAAICGATAGLARVGLLDNRDYTSNGPDWLASVGAQPKGHYVPTQVVTDNRVITAGGMAAVDFANAIWQHLGFDPPPLLTNMMQAYRPARQRATTS